MSGRGRGGMRKRLHISCVRKRWCIRKRPHFVCEEEVTCFVCEEEATYVCVRKRPHNLVCEEEAT